MPKRVRSNAFDVSRTDRDEAEVTSPPLSDLLPRVTPTAVPSPVPSTSSPAPAESDGPPPTAAPAGDARRSAPTERPRGAGGRARASTSRITATPARVPVELYTRAEALVKGPGKPSWGQLVSWTCQRHADDVVAAVLDQLRPAEGLVPRGQNKRGRGTTQITARFTLEEQQAFDATLQQAQKQVDAGSLPAGSRATATAVVIAALEVASA